MGDYPERIVCHIDYDGTADGIFTNGDIPLPPPFELRGDNEYIRADIAEARIRELEGALQEAHDDLLMRATKDSKGRKVVDVGASCWLRICAALQESE